MNQPADVRRVLDQLLALPGDPLGEIIDPDRLAAAGHSGGGITTVGLFSAERDERLKAGMVIAGTDFLGAPFTGPAAGMLFVHGRDDDTVTYRAGHTVFEAGPVVARDALHHRGRARHHEHGLRGDHPHLDRVLAMEPLRRPGGQVPDSGSGRDRWRGGAGRPALEPRNFRARLGEAE